MKQNDRVHHRRRIFAWVGVVVFVMMCVGGWGVWRAASRPVWWGRAGMLPGDAAERGSALERGGARALSEARDDSERWTVSVAEADANAWLAHRLDRWLANRGSEWAAAVKTEGAAGASRRVDFDGRRVRLGFEVDGVVVGLSAVPEVEGGALWLRDPRWFVGRIELAASGARWLNRVLVDRVGGRVSSEGRERLRGALDGSRALFEPASMPLDDGRVVMLVEVRVEADRLLLTCRTLMEGQ
ncbi:MAG: hypothetical protein JNK58_05890 [Phycisphaerae bacterium]|nr:hypothetical protein [Phycisphaerae bacterium]